MMMDPYAHPQHMKVVNHLSYVWIGCVIHSMWVWSLIHCTRTSFSAKEQSRRIRISADFSNLNQQVLRSWHDDGSICPSTAYEGCESPCICIDWMWTPFHVGLEPQPMHKGSICCAPANQDFSRLPKSEPTNVAE
jgi:hypothetical protein